MKLDIGKHVEFEVRQPNGWYWIMIGCIERMMLDTVTGRYWLVVRDERGMLYDVHEDNVTGVVIW